uniref:BTB domain-containing protein n=1 Tax=Ditylenchus dipsaci TaxID=166011 RepID=A0A915CTC8_9BILA
MKVAGSKLDAMVQLLDLFYNRICITDDNVENLMKMAKSVQAYLILTNCEVFLLQSSAISLAQEYGLQHLRKRFMDRCTDADEAKKLKIEPEFKLLKAEILQEIFTKVM